MTLAPEAIGQAPEQRLSPGSKRDLPEASPELHRRLLSAVHEVHRSSEAGATWLIGDVCELFRIDALGSSGGSIENALLQLLWLRAMDRERGARRAEDALVLQRLMLSAPSRQAIVTTGVALGLLDGLALSDSPTYSFYFWQSHAAAAARWWTGMSPSNQGRLLGAIHDRARRELDDATWVIRLVGLARDGGPYGAECIDRALAVARNHPCGAIWLQRLLHVLIAADEPFKVWELGESDPPDRGALAAVSAASTDDDALAARIDGTAHTAYVRDPRLARRVISVARRLRQLADHRPRVLANARRLDDAILHWHEQGGPLTPATLLSLLRAGPTAESTALYWSLRSGAFDLRVVPHHVLAAHRLSWGELTVPALSLYTRNAPDAADDIQISDLSAANRSGPATVLAAVRLRLVCLLHEWEHWRHFSGIGENGRAAEPIELRRITRFNRYLSEMLARLEEQRWAASHDIEIGLARGARLGESPVAYLRRVVERTYYGRRRADGRP